MKKLIATAISAGWLITAVYAKPDNDQVVTNPPPEPPPVSIAPPSTAMPNQPYVYEQRVMGSQVELIPAAEAQAIVDQFRTNYPTWGSPRILIYVNRELVDEKSGLKLASRSQKIETTASSSGTNEAGPVTTKIATSDRYYNNGSPDMTMEDRQMVRDVERLMSRPLKSAGATIVDQHVASELIGDRSLGSLTTDTEQARKDREAVNKTADVVVEVLIGSHDVPVQEISGVRTYTLPDIQMTAIRLKDSKVLGQATSADVISRAGGSAAVARSFDRDAITETTTLALMDDMLQQTKSLTDVPVLNQ